MDIRLAEEADIDGILALQVQIYRQYDSTEKAKEILYGLLATANCDVLVARDGADIIGSAFVFYLPIPAHGRPYAFIEGLVVDEKRRKSGIGTALFQKVIELAKAKNCYKILFTSAYSREEIHPFYEKLGFKKWGHEFRMDLE